VSIAPAGHGARAQTKAAPTRLPAIFPTPAPVLAVAFSPDGSLLAAAVGRDVLVWKSSGDFGFPEQLRPSFRLGDHPDYVTALAFRRDGKVLAAGTQGGVWLWDVATASGHGQRTAVLSGVVEQAVSVAFSPDGRFLAAGSGAPSQSGRITIWELGSETPVRIIDQHSDVVYGLSFHPDGSRLAAGDAARQLKIWDVISGKLLKLLLGHAHYVYAVAWAPDGQTLSSASADGTIKVWKPEIGGSEKRDIETGELMRTLQGHNGPVLALAYDRQTGILASASADRSLRIWQPQSGGQLRTIQAHQSLVQSVAVSPDGRWIASGGWDGALKIWAAADGKSVATLAMLPEMAP
jgi:WD40 repeat protein